MEQKAVPKILDNKDASIVEGDVVGPSFSAEKLSYTNCQEPTEHVAASFTQKQSLY